MKKQPTAIIFLAALSLVLHSALAQPIKRPGTASQDIFPNKQTTFETGVKKQINASINDKQYFVENKGQWPGEVLFMTRIAGVDVWITDHGVVYDFNKMQEKTGKKTKKKITPAQSKDKHEQLENSERYGQVVKMTLLGIIPGSTPEGKEKSKGYYNYFLGNDPSKWAEHVGLYKEIFVKNIYKGIDVRYYFDRGSIRYDYVVQPGAEVKNIKMNFEGTDKINLNGPDELIMLTRFGEVKQMGLQAYQKNNEQKQRVTSRFKQDASGSISFDVGNYDKTRPLIIDPLLYSTFIGGGGSEGIGGIVLDGSGNAIITGSVLSADFPTTPGSYDGTQSSQYYWDVFVTKLNSNGSELVYSTFIGGYYDDVSSSIAIDNTGSVYITGRTSSDYPTTPGAFDETGNSDWVCDEEYCYPGTNGFVTKLNSSGSALLYSTFIGGLGYQECNSISIDGNHNAFITGHTSSADFPTTPGSFDETFNGGYDVFAAKLNNTGSALVYSSYAGGEYDDYSAGIATDDVGNAYLTGYTQSGNFPVTPGAFDETWNWGFDAFVMKLNPTGSALVYSTYVGSNLDDFSYDLAVDASGAVYIAGSTYYATNYPVTAGAYDVTSNGVDDVFVTKLNSSGTGLIYSTFIGGNSNDVPRSIALDGNGNVYVTGSIQAYPSNFSTFPITPGAFDQTFNGGYYDAFVSILNSDGTGLLYSSFLGGGNYDFGDAVVTDVNGYVYVAGHTFSPEFPITNGAFDQTYNGMWDVFVTKLEVTLNNTFSFVPSNNSPFCAGNTLYLTVFPTGATSPTYLWTGPNGFSSTLQNPTIVNSTAAASGTYSVTVSDAAGQTGTATTTVVINALPVASIVASTPVCGACITLTASGGVSYSWSGGNTSNTMVACNDGTYYVTAVSAEGCKDQESIRATPIYPTVAYISASPGCSGCTTLTASSGSAFLWSTGSTNYSITACSVGTYSVVVTDYRGCQSTATTTVGIAEVCAIPLNPSIWNITTNTAQLNWWTNQCAIGYQVRYRVVGTSTWTTKNISSNTALLDLKGLKRGTTYEWQVRSKCTAVPTEMYSAFTSSQFFSTLSVNGPNNSARTTIADEENKIAVPTGLTIWPNPTSAQVMINVNGLKGLSELQVVNMLGQVIISQTVVLKAGQAQKINIAGLSRGVYKLVLRNREGLLTGTFIKK